MIRGPLKAFLGGTVDPAALLFGPGEYIRQQTAIKKNDPRYTEIYRDATSRRATTYGDRPPSRAWLDHKRGVMKRPPRPPRFPAAADRPGAPARCITTRPPRLAGSVDMVVGQLRKSSAPGSQGASPTDPSLSLSLGRRRRGCNNPRAFARNRGETGSLGTARSATQSCRCSHSGIARGSPPFSRCVYGRFQRSREGNREARRGRGEVGSRCAGRSSREPILVVRGGRSRNTRPRRADVSVVSERSGCSGIFRIKNLRVQFVRVGPETRRAGIDRPTSMAKPSRLPSSMMVNARKRRRSESASAMKSSAQVWFSTGGATSGRRTRRGMRRFGRRGRLSRSAQYTRCTRIVVPPITLQPQTVVALPEAPTAISAAITGASRRNRETGGR